MVITERQVIGNHGYYRKVSLGNHAWVMVIIEKYILGNHAWLLQKSNFLAVIVITKK